MTRIKGRVIKLANNKGVNMEGSAIKGGMTYKSFKENAKFILLNTDAIVNILTFHEDVNAERLITGQGEMLKPTSENNNRNFYNKDYKSGGILICVNNTPLSSNNGQQIILLKEKVLLLEEMLIEKEHSIQILLANN